MADKKGTGYIWALVSMPLSGKLFLLVIIALIPRIIVFLQPQIITIDGTFYVKGGIGPQSFVLFRR